MAKRISDNIAMLMQVVDRLAPIRDRLVFLGGAVTELFITEPGVQGFRRTKDVDVVIDVVNLGEYAHTLREQLVGLGLQEDVREGAPVCRWMLDDLIVIRRAKTGHSSAPKTGHRVGGIEQKNRLIRFCWQGA